MTTLLTPSHDEVAVREIAAHCAAQVHDDAHGPQTVFAAPAGAVNASAPGSVALLLDWGIVSARGADALAFMHGQTTNAIADQAADEMRLNGYCSPKGRLLAGGPLWHGDDELCFAVARSLAAPLSKRLAMFVLRAKLKVTDRSDDFAVLGLAGPAAAGTLAAAGISAPAPMKLARPSPTSTLPAGSVAIGLPEVDGYGPRWWLVVPVGALAGLWPRLIQELAPRPSAWWRAGDILAGWPRILSATSERFVPQSVNWELIGAVSFDKGCYPGQEIVARLHYRGKPKRRSFIGRIAGAAQTGAGAPGDDLYDNAGRPAGTIVATAPGSHDECLLMYEAPIASLEGGMLKTAADQVIEALPMPYPIPVDTSGQRSAGQEA
ncbi:MAG: folate-binding protein [Burkholderiaceae bacterium]